MRNLNKFCPHHTDHLSNVARRHDPSPQRLTSQGERDREAMRKASSSTATLALSYSRLTDIPSSPTDPYHSTSIPSLPLPYLYPIPCPTPNYPFSSLYVLMF